MQIQYNFTSPNYNERPNNNIKFIILHYTEMTFDNAIDRLCDPESNVSAHYIIKDSGEIFNLVPEEKRAFHAGKSYWKGTEQINDSSIGIELDNLGNQPFTQNQMQSLIKLCKAIQRKYNILPENILAHSDIAPDRKIDPGIYFDWEMLNKNGIGLWPKNLINQSTLEYKNPYIIQTSLKKLGYKIDITSKFDKQTSYVTRAFQLHFCQKHLISLGKDPFNDRNEYFWNEEIATILSTLLLT